MFEQVDAPSIERRLRETLAGDLRGDAARVIVGLNWTLVIGPQGAGLAHTPARGTAGCRSLPRPGSYAHQPLAQLASLWGSENVFEHAIALAAINAYWNRYDLEASAENGLDLIENRGTRTVVIGRFPGLTQRLPGIAVVEREPRAGEYAESALPDLLPQAEVVAITSSTLVNGSAAHILPLCRNARIVLVGPSTPLSPRLFDLGIDVLSGFVADDVAGLAAAVSEGAAVAALRRHGHNATIQRPVARPS